MTTRTFKQQGQAYGSETASIVASIDGVTVFSGEVATSNEPIPSLPSLETNYGVDLFSWTNEVSFAGTQTLSIAVTGSDLLLTDTLANYVGIPEPGNVSHKISSGADGFGIFFVDQSTGSNHCDPFADQEIDGVPQPTEPDEYTGQWYWVIPAGSTFTATINIQAGLEPPTP